VKQWAQANRCSCRDAKSRFNRRPDSDVCTGVKEIINHTKLVDVEDANDGRYRTTTTLLVIDGKIGIAREYQAPSDKIKDTKTLARRFILRFQMTNIGSIQSIKSTQTLSEQCVYVEFPMKSAGRQEPDPPENCVQK
jgi:hypothetical protein